MQGIANDDGLLLLLLRLPRLLLLVRLLLLLLLLFARRGGGCLFPALLLCQVTLLQLLVFGSLAWRGGIHDGPLGDNRLVYHLQHPSDIIT